MPTPALISPGPKAWGGSPTNWRGARKGAGSGASCIGSPMPARAYARQPIFRNRASTEISRRVPLSGRRHRMPESESAPWVVANLALTDWPMYRPDAPFSWDNVLMRGQTLGYVVATHQDIVQAT